MLSGGRKVEAMRTHGLSKSFVYDNLLTVCKAINNCPVFDLDYSINNWNLIQRAEEFYTKSTCVIFQYCCGAIDGLAIKIRVRSDDT